MQSALRRGAGAPASQAEGLTFLLRRGVALELLRAFRRASALDGVVLVAAVDVPIEKDQPTFRELVTVGAVGDELFPMSMGREVAAEVPGAKLRIVPGAMHSLPTERPELRARLIRNFVTGADDARPRFAYLRTETLPIRARPQYLGVRGEGKRRIEGTARNR